MQTSKTHSKQINDIQSLSNFISTCSSNEAIIPDYPLSEIEDSKYTTINVLDLSKIDQVSYYSPSDQVISVGTGITLSNLKSLISKDNLAWPVMATKNEISLFSIINNGYGGCLEHKFGRLSNLILGMTVVLTNGQIVKCGGKVVKNVSGYDLSKIFIGTHSCFGIIVEATLRLYARQKYSTTFCLQFSDIKQCMNNIQQLLLSNLPLSCLELTNREYITDFQSEKTVNLTTDSPYIVSIKIEGSNEQITKTRDFLIALLSYKTNLIINIESQFESLFWERMSNHTLSQYGFPITINLTFSKMILLAEKLKTYNKDIIWHACPKQGQFICFVKETELDKTIEALSQISKEIAEPFTIAYQNPLYCIKNIPQSDPNIEKLTSNLKKVFDPKGNLNPFVIL